MRGRKINGGNHTGKRGTQGNPRGRREKDKKTLGESGDREKNQMGRKTNGKRIQHQRKKDEEKGDKGGREKR